MKKMYKLLSSLVALCMLLVLLPVTATAADITQVGTEGALRSAVAAGGNIQLTTNITLNGDNTDIYGIDIENGQTVNIDLNGYTISRTQNVFLISHGTLNLTGTGAVQETVDDGHGAIWIKSTATATQENWVNVNVGANVTLRGWAPLGISYIGSSYNAYGVNINLNGKCVSPVIGGNIAGDGAIYINGNIKKPANCPQITIGSTAVIENTLGAGIYAAGYAKWTVESGASITGKNSAIAIKNGELTVNGGTLRCTGPDSRPTELNGNGVNASGAALQIESNASYGHMKFNLNGGTFTSDNGVCIYEYGNPESVDQLNISNGTYTGAKGAFELTNTLTSAGTVKVSGGTFSADPAAYVNTGYKAVKQSDTKYVVAPKATGVTLSDSAVKLEVGTTKTLTATLAPAATLDTVSYTTSDAKVATVDATGKITAVATGTATITATANGKTATCAVTVYKVEPAAAPIVDTTKPVEKVEVGVQSEADKQVVDTTVNNIIAEITSGKTVSAEVMSPETAQAVKEAVEAGKTVTTEVKATVVTPEELPAEVVEKVQDVIKTVDSEKEVVLAQYLDLSVILKADNTELGNVNQLDGKVNFTIAVPETLKKDGRNFFVICVHENPDGTYNVEKLPATFNADGTLSVSTDKFSTYALAYEDAKPLATTPKTGDSATMLWGMLAVFSMGGMAVVIGKKARGKHQEK